jgi:uncharacterized damage-inducible protein DinB
MHPADREILDDFSRTRSKTIDLLRRIPDDLLPVIPAGAEESIAWEFFHVADTVAGWMALCIEDGGPADLERSEDRFALLSQLEETRQRVLDFFARDEGEAMDAVYEPVRNGTRYRFTSRNRVMYLTGHEAHHRGKVVLALRQLGFTDVPFLPFDHTLAT